MADAPSPAAAWPARAENGGVPRVRLAMAHAIDRQAIVDALWNGRTDIPRGLQWNFYGDLPVRDWTVPEHDPARTPTRS